MESCPAKVSNLAHEVVIPDSPGRHGGATTEPIGKPIKPPLSALTSPTPIKLMQPGSPGAISSRGSPCDAKASPKPGRPVRAAISKSVPDLVVLSEPPSHKCTRGEAKPSFRPDPSRPPHARKSSSDVVTVPDSPRGDARNSGVNAKTPLGQLARWTMKREARTSVESPFALAQPLYPHQSEALSWMLEREGIENSPARGGILADEQGLGKTVSSIALCLAANELDAQMRRKRFESGKAEGECRGKEEKWAVLVVAPLSVATQWVAELKEKVLEGYRPSVYLHHGPARARSPATFEGYDVVVTTYGVLVSEDAARKHGDGKCLTKAGQHSSKKPVQKRGPLFRFKWRRVFLDEAHLIRNRKTAMAHAALQLHAERRWCLTGTSIYNTVDDLWTLLHFLKYYFVASFPLERWQAVWKGPLESTDQVTREEKFQELDKYIRPIMLRRTKEILDLPPRNIELRRLVFASTKEKNFYDNVQLRAERTIRRLMERGSQRNLYMNALYHLLRLRQACCHPNLVTLSENEGYKDEDLDAVLKRMLAGDVKSDLLTLPGDQQNALLAKLGPSNPLLQCDGCSEALEFCDFAVVVFRCQHIVCATCANKAAGQCFDCDSCVELLDAYGNISALVTHGCSDSGRDSTRFQPSLVGDLCKVRREAHALHRARWKECGGRTAESLCVEDSRGYTSSMYVDSKDRKNNLDLPTKPGLMEKRTATWEGHSTKIRALLEEVAKMAPGDKAIVFSNWTKMLDYCAMAFRENGIDGFVELTGPMSLEERSVASRKFSSRKDTKIMLLSSAGNVGLNLAAANRVFIIEPWWSPAREMQVMDRAHRIGQNRPVHVVRFVVCDTVEERILSIQDWKMGIMEGVHGVAGSHGAGSQREAGLTMTNLLGLLGISRRFLGRQNGNCENQNLGQGLAIPGKSSPPNVTGDEAPGKVGQAPTNLETGRVSHSPSFRRGNEFDGVRGSDPIYPLEDISSACRDLPLPRDVSLGTPGNVFPAKKVPTPEVGNQMCVDADAMVADTATADRQSCENRGCEDVENDVVFIGYDSLRRHGEPPPQKLTPAKRPLDMQLPDRDTASSSFGRGIEVLSTKKRARLSLLRASSNGNSKYSLGGEEVEEIEDDVEVIPDGDVEAIPDGDVEVIPDGNIEVIQDGDGEVIPDGARDPQRVLNCSLM